MSCMEGRHLGFGVQARGDEHPMLAFICQDRIYMRILPSVLAVPPHPTARDLESGGQPHNALARVTIHRLLYMHCVGTVAGIKALAL